MVNLKPEELEFLKTNDINASNDKHSGIYVKFNSSRSNLPPFLQWRADKCAEVFKENGITQKNYNFIFEVYNYQIGSTSFYDAIFLRLVEFYDDKPVNLVHRVSNQEYKFEYFEFYVTLQDLDKYFQRYRPNNKKKNSLTYVDDNDIVFNVEVDDVRGIVKMTNETKLLVNYIQERPFVGKAYCNFNHGDTFDLNLGIEVAYKNWTTKWQNWFENYTMMVAKFKKIETELRDYQENLNIENNKESDKENNKEITTMKTVTLTNQNTGVVTATTVNFARSYNHEDYINVLNQVKAKNLVGVILGDYKVIDSYSDGRKHRILVLKCEHCGEIIKTTKTMIKKGKVCLKCSQMYTTNEIADYMSNSDNYKQENKDNQKHNVTLTEIKGDLFDAPVWSYIAHCIPGDLTFGGAIAQKIDEYWDMSKKLRDAGYIYETPGNIVLVDNVFNLIASPKKYTHATLEILEDCIHKLADDCLVCEVKTLAMPRIGCGANKLEWDEVKKIILEAFSYTYAGNDEGKQIDILVYLGD